MSLFKFAATATSPLTSPTLFRTAAAASSIASAFPFPASPSTSVVSPGAFTPGGTPSPLHSLEALRASLMGGSSLDLRLPSSPKLPRTRVMANVKGRGTDVGAFGAGETAPSATSSLFGQLASFDAVPSLPANTVPSYASLGAAGAPTPLCSPSVATALLATSPFPSTTQAVSGQSPRPLGTGKKLSGGHRRRASFKVELPELVSEERLLREGGKRVKRVDTPFEDRKVFLEEEMMGDEVVVGAVQA